MLPKKQRLSQKHFDKVDVEKTENIPEKFMQHVLSLGFQESDAAILYQDKENWMGISRKGMVASCFIFALRGFNLKQFNII